MQNVLLTLEQRQQMVAPEQEAHASATYRSHKCAL